MTTTTKFLTFLLFLFLVGSSRIIANRGEDPIRNGIPWFDDRRDIVNAHGACIVEDGGRYYLFGEYKTNKVNRFNGFSCYSSNDLSTWKFENIVLGVQPNGILGPQRIGERVKVMKCPATGEYVMYMHCDDMGYNDPHIGYATYKTIAGDYEFQGFLLYNGQPIRRWDMGTYQDTDGTGYLLIHHGIIYRLSNNYRSAEERVLSQLGGSGESPAMMKKNGIYYMLYFNLTSWEHNDNYYYTAPAPEGPWTYRGLFAPKGSLTYNSQCSFILTVPRGADTLYMYMGDRWSFPHQSDAATQVWLPLQTEGTSLTLPQYWEAWDFRTVKPVDLLAGGKAVARSSIKLSTGKNWETFDGLLRSTTKGSSLEASFTGTNCVILGQSDSSGGYARISVMDASGKVIHSSFVDFYSKAPARGIKFMTPKLPHDDYKVRIEVTGIISEWFKKNGDRFGSTDCAVAIEKLLIYDQIN